MYYIYEYRTSLSVGKAGSSGYLSKHRYHLRYIAGLKKCGAFSHLIVYKRYVFYNWLAMRVVFMGTPSFVIPVLDSLFGSDREIVGVYTNRDLPRGRGRQQGRTPVKEYATQKGLQVFQPNSLRTLEARKGLESLSPDVVVLAAYGKLVPEELLEVPRWGFLNIHPSLLPKYRGPSPVQTALLDGERKTGASLIQLDKGIDSGPILGQKETAVRETELVLDLTRRLFQLGSELLLETLPGWGAGSTVPKIQDEDGASYTRKFLREDGKVEWDSASNIIFRRYKAFTPWPGLFTHWDGRILKLITLSTSPVHIHGEPGTVVPLTQQGEPAIGIITKDGTVCVDSLQLEGRRVQPSGEFLRGHPDILGARLPN